MSTNGQNKCSPLRESLCGKCREILQGYIIRKDNKKVEKISKYRRKHLGTHGHCNRYSHLENEMILHSLMTDVELCEKLGRSLDAIKSQRYKLLGKRKRR